MKRYKEVGHNQTPLEDDLMKSRQLGAQIIRPNDQYREV